jgi:hypothetical protein
LQTEAGQASAASEKFVALDERSKLGTAGTRELSAGWIATLSFGGQPSFAGSPAGSTSLAHSVRFHPGTGGSHSARGTKRERSTSSIRCM